MLDVFVDLLQLRLRAPDQEGTEVRTTVRQDRDRVGDVVDDQRLVDVHLQITTSTAKALKHPRNFQGNLFPYYGRMPHYGNRHLTRYLDRLPSPHTRGASEAVATLQRPVEEPYP